MSYTSPPGLKPPSANLPARPPPSAVGPSSFKPSGNNGQTKPAFAAFAPRAIALTGQARTNTTSHYSTQPTSSYSAAPIYSQPAPDAYKSQTYDPSYYQGATPQIRNPFVLTPSGNGAPTATGAPSYPPGYDPEYEAQIQQWQSAYIAKDDSRSGVVKPATAGPTTSGPTTRTDTPTTAQQKTVKRTGGGTEWTDSSLLEWDPAHFRLFIGNLAGEVTDESLLKAFAKYSSVQKARVIRDKRTTKSKGYGFVSFSDGDDYFQAAREMQGKYIGSHPVLIKRAMTEVRPTTIKDNKHGKNKGKGNHGKIDHGGISKKTPKTKGGLKLLG